MTHKVKLHKLSYNIDHEWINLLQDNTSAILLINMLIFNNFAICNTSNENNYTNLVSKQTISKFVQDNNTVTGLLINKLILVISHHYESSDEFLNP